MKLKIFRSLWGLEEPFEPALAKVKAEGYAGIEASLGFTKTADDLQALINGGGFEFIAMIFTEGKSADDHLRSFRELVAKVLPLKPVAINCFAGKDRFSLEESRRFFSEALRIERDLGTKVGYETHRGRILFNPWVTARLLEEFEDLKLVCDFSHWVCVCERLLDGELDLVRRAAARAVHLHARVGYEEGPQVPDPRAPEFERHLLAHEAWWDLIWDAQEQRGDAATTLTPEFGPPPYLHTLPFTNAPVANLGEICDWMAKRQAGRFARRGASG